MKRFINGWIRSRLRSMQLKKWKNPRKFQRMMIRAGYNLKSAVLSRIVGQAPVFNPKYLDFVDHCGFTIAPCNVGKGNEKGRVENAVGYVKKNFLAGLDIPNFTAVNPAARHWLDTVANVRIHGETRKKPLELFKEERPCLNALPENPFDIATVSQARASSQFRITIDQPLLSAGGVCRQTSYATMSEIARKTGAKQL